VKVNFPQGMLKRREIIYSGRGFVDEDVVMNVLLLGAVDMDTGAKIMKTRNYDSKALEVELRVNGVTVNLERGMARLASLFRSVKEKDGCIYVDI